MPGGTPVSRHWILILKDGRVVVDWGKNRYQDILTGEMLECQENEISHTAQDQDLTTLKKSGLIDRYDTNQAYLVALPEPPQAASE